MIAISSYKFAAQQKASGQQQWFDVGSGTA